MAVQVTVPFEKTFSSSQEIDDTFKYLADFERSIPENFSGIETFKREADGTFLWEFEKLGHSGYEIQIKLQTESTLKAPKVIEMRSIAKPGFAQFQGKWELAHGVNGCQVKFTANFGLELQIPFLMKAIAVPLAQKEFTKFFDKYIQRVEKNLE